jgi:hypothetical protein
MVEDHVEYQLLCGPRLEPGRPGNHLGPTMGSMAISTACDISFPGLQVTPSEPLRLPAHTLTINGMAFVRSPPD